MVGTCFQPCLNGVFSQIMFWEKYFGFYFPEFPELGEQSLVSLLLKGGSKKMTKKDPHLTLGLPCAEHCGATRSHWGGFTTTLTASPRREVGRDEWGERKRAGKESGREEEEGEGKK